MEDMSKVADAVPAVLPAAPELLAVEAKAIDEKVAAAAMGPSSSGSEASSSGGGAPSATPTSDPTAIIIIGMAGSGKTTLMQRLNAHLHAEKTPYYMVNLDPAVLETPFGAHIDIRDTVNYREVMKQYALGPNGGILTALNLFATRFEQVLGLIGKRVAGPTPPKYVLFDTPGQIEIFTWSASGQIITASLASAYPTVIVYVVDTVRCRNAVSFMSNMLYACSILYKMKLPLVLAFNKIDLAPCDFAQHWMDDLDSFTEALQKERSYMGSLAQSMALMLEEFYASLTAVGVSALSGEGMEPFFAAVDKARTEYESGYALELAKQKEQRKLDEEERQRKSREALVQDGLMAAGAKVVLDGNREPADPGAAVAAADEDEGEGEHGEEEEEEEEEPPSMYSRGAGYNKEDEQWAMEHPNDREELEGLRRYLAKKKAGSSAEAGS